MDPVTRTRPWRVAADVWLDGIEPWQRANGVVPERVLAGTIVHIRDGDDAHAARFGGWANLAEAVDPLRAGVHDGRGAVAAASPFASRGP